MVLICGELKRLEKLEVRGVDPLNEAFKVPVKWLYGHSVILNVNITTKTKRM